ncbi:hypothetical protein Mucpa_1729 [Mucilaginibacter paludis DSM 18603]|uniref:Uncharacterized protein n=1 Tax=Mucilaginibacter paludis DSM 18603 TaxID=714943 RepID=H1Y8G5_9SPHI|nr:hypothetical protein Mucpa_1729 [Mucilaginibacter paludis DSM 18603]
MENQFKMNKSILPAFYFRIVDNGDHFKKIKKVPSFGKHYRFPKLNTIKITEREFKIAQEKSKLFPGFNSGYIPSARMA